MTELFFEIEYVDRQTGEVVSKTVDSMKLAQKLVRELAIAHGRVAKIRRKRRAEWRVITVDLLTGEVHRNERPVTKAEANEHWRYWKAKKEQAVCVPWPNWAPPPTITFVLQRGA